MQGRSKCVKQKTEKGTWMSNQNVEEMAKKYTLNYVKYLWCGIHPPVKDGLTEYTHQQHNHIWWSFCNELAFGLNE